MRRKDIKKIQRYFGHNVTYENKGLYMEMTCRINFLKGDEIWDLFKRFIVEGYNDAEAEKKRRRRKMKKWKQIKN